MIKTISKELDLTTQGPLYPPSEVMDENGNFIVIGMLNYIENGELVTRWGRAIVSANTPAPRFGDIDQYNIIERFDDSLPENIGNKILHTLPLPLPCANYPMVFAPEQYPDANSEHRPSYPFHKTPIPDYEIGQSRQLLEPVTLTQWMRAKGELKVSILPNGRSARFEFLFENLLPNSLYTIMSLRQRDLDPENPTRPWPLGIPNVFVTNNEGGAYYSVTMENPFPRHDQEKSNRIINVVVLWMSYQMSHGGAIGRFGLGGDIHAQLKFKQRVFDELETN
ncbi:hypothetical protein [Sessilibacter sp. MAH2]